MIASMLDWLQQTGLAVQIRDSLFAFPAARSRCTSSGWRSCSAPSPSSICGCWGWPRLDRPFRRLAGDTLKWTLGGFVVTAVTGALMFITNATVYFHNAYFRAKVVLLVLAALNALVFELTARRTVAAVGRGARQPAAARAGRGDAVAGHLDRRDRHRPDDRLHGHAGGRGRAGPRGDQLRRPTGPAGAQR